MNSAEFQQIVEEQFARPGEKLPRATRRAVIGLGERFYRKVYPPGPEDAREPFDFADPGFLRDFMREAARLTRARGTRPELIFLGRAETGLYTTLHRLRARVPTSAITRRLLSALG